MADVARQDRPTIEHPVLRAARLVDENERNGDAEARRGREARTLATCINAQLDHIAEVGRDRLTDEDARVVHVTWQTAMRTQAAMPESERRKPGRSQPDLRVHGMQAIADALDEATPDEQQ